MIVRRIVAERLKIDVIVRSEALANIASPLAALRNADVIPAQIKPLPFGMQTTARMLTVAGRRYDALRQPERVSRGSSGGQRRRHARVHCIEICHALNAEAGGGGYSSQLYPVPAQRRDRRALAPDRPTRRRHRRHGRGEPTKAP